MARLHVNGKSYDVATHPSAALLWALHDEIGCSSVKYGCGSEQCVRPRRSVLRKQE